MTDTDQYEVMEYVNPDGEVLTILPHGGPDETPVLTILTDNGDGQAHAMLDKAAVDELHTYLGEWLHVQNSKNPNYYTIWVSHGPAMRKPDDDTP